MTSETSETPPGRQRRRRYDPAFKRTIVEQTLVPGASVARIAREHDINANQLFKWRRQFLLEQPPAPTPAASAPSTISLLPVTVVAEGSESAASPSPVPPLQPGQIEITLAGGAVRVQGAVDNATLQVVLSSLRR
jgi:transposase